MVGVFHNNKNVAEKRLSGIVTAMTTSLVSVTFDELPDTLELSAFDGSLQLVKLCNDVTYRRIRRYICCNLLLSTKNIVVTRCLEDMQSSVVTHPLVSVLFGTTPLAEVDPQFSSHLTQLSNEVYTNVIKKYMYMQ